MIDGIGKLGGSPVGEDGECRDETGGKVVDILEKCLVLIWFHVWPKLIKKSDEIIFE